MVNLYRIAPLIMKKILSICSVVFCLIQAEAQSYKIEFKIDGLSDTTIYLGNYFGESTYVKDTAQVTRNGEFLFEGREPLNKGMYFLVLNKTRLFDFIVSEDQEFKLTTSTEDYVKNLKVIGDIENEVYVQDMLYNMERNQEASRHVAVIQDSTADLQRTNNARKALDAISAKVAAHQNEIIQKYPNLLITRILKANQRLDIPETPAGMDANEFGYNYMRLHYWDGFDLADTDMLRIGRPIYKEKVESYFDQLIIPQADSILKEANRLAAVAKSHQDTYKYFIWTLTLKYQNPGIMGLDEVFVKLIDMYFESGEMDFWANDQLKKNLKERADQLRLSLIGNKAPNMVMMDNNRNMRSMYDIKNKYTILYFFDPDCGHCKKETPLLKNFYDNTSFDVEIFAVSADTSMVKMNNYISQEGLTWITVNGPRTSTGSYHNSYDAMTTPTLYVLNEEKKIIAKKIPSARLDDFLNQYEKFHTKTENQP